MRILVVGGNGVLGGAVVSALSDRHEVVVASRSGDEQVDITDPESITALYSRVGRVDAVACTAGKVPFADLDALTIDQYADGIADKLVGQIALVRLGLEHVTDGGSFTLISGILADEPIRTGTVASTVNGGIHSFVTAAAVELPRGQRINAVSPTVLEESWEAYAAYFPGFPPVPAADAARAYVRSIEGVQTGQVFRVGY